MDSNPKDQKSQGKINPDDFLDYEERFIENGGGGSKGSGSGKGKKTLKAIKTQAVKASAEGRKIALADKLVRFLKSTGGRDDATYLDWVNHNLSGKYSLDLDEVEIAFARSGGPGGQNVNKRETKVIALHRPTGVQTSADQTRSQLENRQLALKELESRLKEHLSDWKMYLGSGRKVDKELVKELLDNS
jgi:protein subunit release factor B